MGGEQAAGVMKTVTEQKFLREGKEPPHAEIDKMYKGIVDQFDRESTALYGTAHLWDDGIIDPRDTRRILAFTLLDRPRIDRAAAQSHHLRRRKDVSDEIHARARGLAPDLEDADRSRDQSQRRRMGEGRRLPRPRAVQEDGRCRPSGRRQAGRVRRLGARLLLRHDLRGIAGPGERRLDPHGDRRADLHGDAGAGPLRQRRAAPGVSGARRSAATTSPASACRRPAPAPTSPRSRPRPAASAATG